MKIENWEGAANLLGWDLKGRCPAPRFVFGPIMRVQNWPLYRCAVYRTLDDGDMQIFVCYASTSELCAANANDICEALNRGVNHV
jgi:hypothetical protein